MKMNRTIALVGSLLAGFLTNANAWSTCKTGQWASIGYGSWTVYMDEWGASATNCQICANNYGNFAGSGSWTGGGVKAYPHAEAKPNLSLTASHSSTSSFNVSSPSNTGSICYDWTYDLWTTNNADEIMIIENLYPGAGGGWGTKIGSAVNIGGHTFDVWQANPGWNVIQFIRNSKTNSGSEDLWACLQWCRSHGRLKQLTWTTLAFGVEITSTNGWQTWTCNSFSASWH
jgi:hypothetical protein